MDSVPPPELPPVSVAVIGYATPAHLAATGLWTQLGRLYTTVDAPFPDRCVRCNEPTLPGHRVRKTMRWHNPTLLALILLQLVIYIVVAAVMTKRSKVDFGLCPEHWRRRKLFGGIFWAGLIVVVGMIAAGITLLLLSKNADNIPGVVLLCAVLPALIGLFLFHGYKLTPFRPNEITKTYAVYSGCGPRFLDSLPRVGPM